MYAYYHEHFEIANWDTTVRITCVCANDFIWTVANDNQDNEPHYCPHCGEKWLLGRVDDYILLTRAKSGASIRLPVMKTEKSRSLLKYLFPPCKPQNELR